MSEKFVISFRHSISQHWLNAKRSEISESWLGDGGDSARILTLDGVDQAVFFPSVVTHELRGGILQSVLEYTWNGHLDPDKDHTNGDYKMDAPDYWKNPDVPMRGCTYLSHSNHQIGHPNERSLPSASLTGGSNKFADGMKLLSDLSVLSEFANHLIKMVDPEVHTKMVDLRHKMIASSPHVKAICAVSPALHAVVGIIVNRRSGAHKDSTDAKGSWAVMFVFGDFDGGELELEISGIQVTSRFQNGDAIVLRARDVIHSIRDWNGKLRVTIVYYTKDSVWREYRA